MTYISVRLRWHGGPADGPYLRVLRQVDASLQLEEGEVVVEAVRVPLGVHDLPLESHPEAAGGPLRHALGVNSIDIMNFGHESGHETGPSSAPNSVLGHYKFRHASKLQK